MALTPGTRLGVYEVTAPIGAGGMGQVYRARDTRLDREVAIKILPEAFAHDTDRLARFQREAKTLASLNHPHIAAIYGLEEFHRGGSSDPPAMALVMELVEGVDLSQRIAKGAIPLDEALPIAKQIAEALEAAHEQGIIHRDLKPANIKVRADGTVKVLDFGLAKAMEPAAGSSPSMSMSPTITTPAMTQAGMILGTAAYMAPEQARGKTVDKRADIWAFGCVLYEMLTGRRAFGGDDVTDTLAFIITREPDCSALPRETPPSIHRLLRRCLVKERQSRLPEIGTARLEIDDALSPSPDQNATIGHVAPGRGRDRFSWGAAGLMAGLLLGITAIALVAPSLLRGTGGQSRDVARVLIAVSPADQIRAATDAPGDLGQLSRTALALSPDGRTLVFSAVRGDRQQLYARTLNQLEAVPLPGTEGAANPFFSPDGLWVGFWANGAIKKVPLSGGAPTTVCESAAVFGASWGSDDMIVFAPQQRGGLSKVSATGGAPTALTVLDAKAGEVSHRLPQLLPGNQAVLFTVTRTLLPTWDDTQVVVQSLATGDRKVLIEGGADARYVPTGHLVYVRRGALMAAPFDVRTLTVMGGTLTLMSGLMQAANMPNAARDSGAGQFAIAESGSLAYIPGSAYAFPDRSLAWVDRSGRVEPLVAPPRVYNYPRLSPDGTQVLFSTQGDRNVWVYDFRRGTTTRLTTDGRNMAAIWTPDGKRVTFGSSTAGTENLFWKPADGGAMAERLTTSPNQQRASAWSPDGQVLVFVEVNVAEDILTFSSAANGEPSAVVRTRFNENYPEFSPDGRWLAYASDESGRQEVYVQPYPGPGPKVLVSTEGGTAPAWRKDGKELFYVVPGAVPRIMVCTSHAGCDVYGSQASDAVSGAVQYECPGAWL